MYYIHPTECIECGMCESICPVDAIRYADEVEAAELPFIGLNEDAFRNSEGEIVELAGWSKDMTPLPDPPNLAVLVLKIESSEDHAG